MSLARLAWTFLWARPLVAAFNLGLLTLGVAALVFVTVASAQLQSQVSRALKGIDLVVGAKGSPLQLILAGVFHLDAPTGNIAFDAVAALRRQPRVAGVIPLSVGDTVRGYRIVGTEPAYLDLYGARLAAGALWSQPMQSVLGAEVALDSGLKPGQRFAGSHGLAESGAAHDEAPYTVSGVLAPCACVLDRLALTQLESVWAVHEPHHVGEHEEPAETAPAREVTLALVTYASPLAAVSLPRWVNAQDGLQAAAPALESARLLRMAGVGVEVLRGFALVLMAVAALSVFIALMHALREREHDLALMRMLGAPARRVAALPLFEAFWLALLGLCTGTALGWLLLQGLAWSLRTQRSLALHAVAWPIELLWVGLGTLALAVLAAAVPSWRVFRLDVTRLLQAPR